MEDWQLLQNYLERGSEAAFRELMGRHLDLVYSTALRRLGDAQAAEDVAQGAFCLLVRKAPSLKPATSVVGWLYQTAFFMASRHQESERRRRGRELEAARLTLDPDPEPVRWERIAPVLDEAMNRLSDSERNLLLLRFFKGTPLHEVGKSLGVSEDAARMRVNRSLDKLRELLQERGIASTAAALAVLLTQQAVEAAPLQASQAIQTAVINNLAAAGGPGFLTAPRTLMNKLRLKSALLGGSALILGFIVTLHVYNRLQAPPTPRAAAPNPLILSPTRGGATPRPELPRVGLNAPTSARKAVSDTTEQPAQVLISAKYLEMLESAIPSNPLLVSDFYRASVISAEQTLDLVVQFEKQAGVDVMSAPRVTTLSGRQAQIAVTTERPILLARSHSETRTHPFDSPVVSEITYVPTGESSEVITNLIQTGVTFDVIPDVQDDGVIQLTFVPSIRDFMGYQEPTGPSTGQTPNGPANPTGDPLPVPRVCVMQSTNHVSVWNGQTVLCGPFYHETIERVAQPDEAEDLDLGDNAPPPAGAGRVFPVQPVPRKTSVKKAIFVLVTAQIVDAVGNLTGSAEPGATENSGTDTARR